MVTRYCYGHPIETDAILCKPQGASSPLPYFLVDEKSLSFTFSMAPADRVYGLGENIRGINKRGWIYESKCADVPQHLEDRKSLYGAHNFIIVEGETRFGVFFDYPGILTFDVGYTKPEALKVTAADWNLDVYIFTGDSLRDIVRQFRRLIGRSYIAPLWAFGFGQSRWGYKNADDVREVVKKHRELGLPLDSVYMDIDYMERYKDFSVNQERFPDFAAFNQEMKREHIHLVPIIDAAVKVEEGYNIYEEGMEKGYFCKKADGSPFIAGVWPGNSVFPDTLNADARRWFGEQYKFLLDQGVEGFWNDMNEPAQFYTLDRLEAVKAEMDNLGEQEFNGGLYHTLVSTPDRLVSPMEDYKTFYHNKDGEVIRHDHVHNLYGYNMTRAAGEAFDRLEPDKRILLFSRASYIGMHRYGGIWQGDNASWWSHLLLNVKMMPSLNMCGFLYTGADLGGFGSDATEDLLLRWLAFGIFTPLMRNHSCTGTRFQEAYRFENIPGFRHIMGMRYKLLPYLYSEYMKAALRDDMMFRPLAFDYPTDEIACHVEDQLLLGDGMMLAPVYEQNAIGRCVYLPESMKLVRFREDGSVTEEVLPMGHHYIPVALTDVIFFIRPGCLIPLSKGGQFVDAVDFEDLTCLHYGEASYEYYHDDGISKNYDDPKNITTLRA